MASLRRQRVAVNELRLAAGSDWQDLDLVFPSRRGTILCDAHILGAWYHELERLGLPRIRMHDLRHAKATQMVEQGEQMEVVQRTLGHASKRITNEIYVGEVPAALRQAAERWGKLIDPESQTQASG